MQDKVLFILTFFKYKKIKKKENMIINQPSKIDKHTVGCIMTCDGKYLHFKRKKDGLWGSVAGTVEKGETPEKAIEREIKEELGISIKPYFFMMTCHLFGKDKKTVAYHMFEYDFKEDPSKKIKLNKEELEEFVLLPFEETLNLNLFEDEDYVITLHHNKN